MSANLEFLAGPEAYESIRRDGFSPARIGAIAGASGGAKWLVLSQIDRVILRDLLPQLEAPVYTIGSSIGAWRFACYAQSDPLAALDRFEAGYLEQSYSSDPDRGEITRKSREILELLLGDTGSEQIVNNPVLRTSIMTVRARHLTASESTPVLSAGLTLAMIANAVYRPLLGAFFERGLFYDTRDQSPWYSAPGFPLQRIPLREDNVLDAVIASGAIPLVLSGVRNIAGAKSGVYRDGGVIDYHFDVPLEVPGRITLFPHFFNWLKPGWFDKRLPWRRVNERYFSSTLIICPSPQFIATLPGRRVPDRKDFLRYTQDERLRVWREVVARCEALAEELTQVLQGDRLPARLKRL